MRISTLAAGAAIAVGLATTFGGSVDGSAARTSAVQDVIDRAFRPVIPRPAYPSGQGPVVAVDRGHHGFYEADEAFSQLADMLDRDGYRVSDLREAFATGALSSVQVLIVVNALADRDDALRELPTPLAFTAGEVAAVSAWVRGGGSLLLVADHMPFPGAAAELGRAMGVEFMNGFAVVEADWDPLVFRRADGGLRSHPITDGRTAEERIDSAVTFVSGQAFRAVDAAVRPLLVLGRGVVSINPTRAWAFSPATPRVNVEGWLQGAAIEPGAGRAAIFGEAAMFAAQLVGPRRVPTGMNAPSARQNFQLFLNTMHWLSRVPGMRPDKQHGAPADRAR